MPKVTADIVHPAAKVQRIQDEKYTRYTVVRVFLIENLDDTGDGYNQSATALARSLSAKGVPQVGSPAPGIPAGCIALDYDTEVIPESTSSVYLMVTYRTIAPITPGNAPAFTVSDDSMVTGESTELHPRDKKPMLLYYDFKDKAGKTKPEIIQASFRYSRPIRKVLLSGYVVGKDLSKIRAAIKHVNIERFLELDRGFWRFDEFHSEGTLYGTIKRVTIGIVTRTDEPWMSFETFHSPEVGRRISVDPAIVKDLVSKGYEFNWFARNGITAAGLYPLTNFSAMFGTPKI